MKIIRFISKYFLHARQSFRYSREKIDNFKIILWSYRGRSYACNPKYITEYIISNNLVGKYRIVWAFNNPEEYIRLNELGIKTIKYYSDEFFQELMSSHFVITNTRFGLDFHKRKGQIYFQTLHGVLPLKYCEKDAKKYLKKDYILNAISDSKKIDYLLSGSVKTTEILKQMYWYKGEILNIGSPRNDMYFRNNKYRNIIEEKYSFKDKKIILYAPTFRNNKSGDAYNLDFDGLIDAMHQRFGFEYVVLCRLHPNLKGYKIFDSEQTNVIDVTNFDDMQELMDACDVLITDFSSSMFETCISRKICFLYASDYTEYIKNERPLYFDMEKDLPFPLSKDNNELKQMILTFDSQSYFSELDRFSNSINITEDGTASKRILDIIEDKSK